MVEIIKQGKPYATRYFTIECPRCSSTLGFSGAEVLPAIDFTYIICPVCTETEDKETWINVKTAKEPK